MRFERSPHGRGMVTPVRLNSCNDESSPLKSLPEEMGAWPHTRLIRNVSRSGTGREKCLTRTGRTLVGFPETDRVLSRAMCGTVRANASSR